MSSETAYTLTKPSRPRRRASQQRGASLGKCLKRRSHRRSNWAHRHLGADARRRPPARRSRRRALLGMSPFDRFGGWVARRLRISLRPLPSATRTQHRSREQVCPAGARKVKAIWNPSSPPCVVQPGFSAAWGRTNAGAARRVLGAFVVEDEPLVALQVQEFLKRGGHVSSSLTLSLPLAFMPATLNLPPRSSTMG
jgi:hypothetical protein